MTRDLSLLLRPRSIAVIGGGAWCKLVLEQCLKIGFRGEIWVLHPSAPEIAGIRCYRRVADLPSPPDASFIGVNRNATIDIVRELAAINAGGAVCFASGFLESKAEDKSGAILQHELLEAAGRMPILGPNCYGFINYLDGALLWPDQHGGERVDKGVALITQSSNVAINLTMQQRALPIAYVVTAGNQAQTGLASIGETLLEDPRVTALGLHIEGFGDIRAFESLARKARRLGKPIVALKVGKSEQARFATISHTASLAGGEAGAEAMLARFGIARLQSLTGFIETLKLLHVTGPLPSNRIASISCSGGEASLAADAAVGHNLNFPSLNAAQKRDLRAALGPMVALANPLDYNTYIWRDTAVMTQAWGAMMDSSLALTLLIVDFPRPDRCDAKDWECAIQAALGAKAQTGANVAMVATLPESMPEPVAKRLIAGGVTPLNGLTEAIAAAEAAALCYKAQQNPEPIAPLILSTGNPAADLVFEAAAKSRLSAFGVPVPRGQSLEIRATAVASKLASEIGFPVVLKVQGFAHKSEAGAVIVNVKSTEELDRALKTLPPGPLLIEEMVSGAVAELLVGVVRDPAHGFVLTIGAGGVLTELLQDSVSLLVPARKAEVTEALLSLRISRLLLGYRGKAPADISAIVATIMSVQNYVAAHADDLEEIEINPLLCCPDRAIAADVLLREEIT